MSLDRRERPHGATTVMTVAGAADAAAAATVQRRGPGVIRRSAAPNGQTAAAAAAAAWRTRAGTPSRPSSANLRLRRAGGAAARAHLGNHGLVRLSLRPPTRRRTRTGPRTRQ